LSYGSFCAEVNNQLYILLSIPIAVSIPQGSVLDHVSFFMYTMAQKVRTRE